jgi:hypothetical protein
MCPTKLAGLLDDVAAGTLCLTVEATVPLERVPVVGRRTMGEDCDQSAGPRDIVLDCCLTYPMSRRDDCPRFFSLLHPSRSIA